MTAQPMRAAEIEVLLQPYLDGLSLPAEVLAQFAAYLALLVKWNARTNLTAIREPIEIVKRHFGESIFAGRRLKSCEKLLDFGSGAGFPGVPIQLIRPDIRVTLAESQNKKATFLREVVRTLELETQIWAGRVEAMPADRVFDVVALRAVDNMDAAVLAASNRASDRLLIISTERQPLRLPPDFQEEENTHIPETEAGRLVILSRIKNA